MPTIINPNSPVYIDSYAASGTGGGSPTPLVKGSGVSVALVTATGSNYDVELPTADIGDVVEVYADGHSVMVYPPSGETIPAGMQFIFNESGRRYRKVAASAWVAL